MKQVLSRLRSSNSLSERQQWILDFSALHRAFRNKIIILQHSMLYQNEYKLSEELATIADLVVMLRERLVNQKRSTRSWFVPWAYLSLRSKQTFMSQNIYYHSTIQLHYDSTVIELQTTFSRRAEKASRSRARLERSRARSERSRARSTKEWRENSQNNITWVSRRLSCSPSLWSYCSKKHDIVNKEQLCQC